MFNQFISTFVFVYDFFSINNKYQYDESSTNNDSSIQLRIEIEFNR